jgi:Flp pilus assembly pilin Flp
VTSTVIIYLRSLENSDEEAASLTMTLLTKTWNCVRSFIADESGQAATEYILVIGIIIIPLAVAFNELQGVLKNLLKDLARLFSGPGV